MNAIRVSTPEAALRIESYAGRGDLERFLAEKGLVVHVPSVSQGHDREFWSIDWTPAGVETPLHLALASEGHGIAPEVRQLPGGNRLLIGVNSEAICIDALGKILSTASLTGVFYEFIPALERGMILVVHELGIVAISKDGAVIWQHDAADVLTATTLKGDVVELADAEGNQILLDVGTGAVKQSLC